MRWSLAASCCATANPDTTTLPSFVPSVAENQEIRSWGRPLLVRTASTWERERDCNRDSVAPTPDRECLRCSRPRWGSSCRFDGYGRAPWTSSRGCTRCARRMWRSGAPALAPGSACRPCASTMRIPPSAIFCLHEPSREARLRVDVLDVVPRVGERPARSRRRPRATGRCRRSRGRAAQPSARARRRRRRRPGRTAGRPLSWSVQRAVDMRARPRAAAGRRSRFQLQVMVGCRTWAEAGSGRACRARGRAPRCTCPLVR